MSPAFPSWMRSSNGTPLPRYFLAMEITSRRFDSMRRRLAPLSPSWARLLRSRSSPASSNLPSRTLLRYCVRTSCASSIPSPLPSQLLRGRVRTPDPRPAVRHEPAQDPLVQARRDPPAPPARALELETPSLSRLGQGRLLERPQAATRQRPGVD